jgi:hypothetical protein
MMAGIIDRGADHRTGLVRSSSNHSATAITVAITMMASR